MRNSMGKPRYVFAAALFLCMTVGPLSAETVPLTLDDAISSARQNNLGLASTAIDLRSAQRDEDTSWNLYLPSISATVSNTGSTDVFSTAPAANYNRGLGVALSTSLSINPYIKDQMELYGINYEIQRVTYEQAQHELERSVIKLFYYLVTEEKNIELQKNNLELSRKQYERVQALYENGYVSELELLSSQLAYESLKPAYTQTLNAYTVQLLAFKVLLGLDLDAEVKLEGDVFAKIRELDTDRLKGYLPDTYSLKLLDLSRASLENTGEITRKTSLSPTVTVSGQYSLGMGSWSNVSTTWSDSAQYTVAVTIPLDGYIPGSKTDVSLQKIQDSIDQLDITRKQTLMNLEQTVISRVQSLNALAQQIEAAEFNRDLSQRVYDMAMTQYEAGMSEFLDVEDAQADLFSARQQLLSFNYQYVSGLTDLLYDLQIDSEQL